MLLLFIYCSLSHNDILTRYHKVKEYDNLKDYLHSGDFEKDLKTIKEDIMNETYGINENFDKYYEWSWEIITKDDI